MHDDGDTAVLLVLPMWTDWIHVTNLIGPVDGHEFFFSYVPTVGIMKPRGSELGSNCSLSLPARAINGVVA